MVQRRKNPVTGDRDTSKRWQIMDLLTCLGGLGERPLPRRSAKLLEVLFAANSNVVSHALIREKVHAAERRGPTPRRDVTDRMWAYEPVSTLKGELEARLRTAVQLIHPGPRDQPGYRLDAAALAALLPEESSAEPEDRGGLAVFDVKQGGTVRAQPLVVLDGPGVLRFVEQVLLSIVKFLRNGGAITILWHWADHDYAVAVAYALELQCADAPDVLKHLSLTACKEESGLPGVLLCRRGTSFDDQQAFIVQERSAGRRGPLPHLQLVPWTSGAQAGRALLRAKQSAADVSETRHQGIFRLAPDFNDAEAPRVLKSLKRRLEDQRSQPARKAAHGIKATLAQSKKKA